MRKPSKIEYVTCSFRIPKLIVESMDVIAEKEFRNRANVIILLLREALLARFVKEGKPNDETL